MIKFNRYPHVADLLEYYIDSKKRNDISSIYKNGIKNEQDAESFCKFVWGVVDDIHLDNESEASILGNTDMIPDLAYEMATYMKKTGYFYIWDKTLIIYYQTHRNHAENSK